MCRRARSARLRAMHPCSFRRECTIMKSVFSTARAMILRAGALLLLAASAIGCCCTGFTPDADGGDHPPPASPDCSAPAVGGRTTAFGRAVKDFFARVIGGIFDDLLDGIVKVFVAFWMISAGVIVLVTCTIVLIRRRPVPIAGRHLPESQ